MSPINSPYEANVPRAPSLSHAFSRSIVRTGAGYRSLTGKAAAGRALQRMQFDRVVPVRCAATPASYYYERRCCGCAYRSGRPSSAWWRGKARLYASERAAAAAAARASTPGRAAGLDGACAQSPHTEASMHARRRPAAGLCSARPPDKERFPEGVRPPRARPPASPSQIRRGERQAGGRPPSNGGGRSAAALLHAETGRQRRAAEAASEGASQSGNGRPVTSVRRVDR